MARPLAELQALLKAIPGVEQAYIQAPTTGMKYPCIMIERSSSNTRSADNNSLYFFKKGYTVTVIDRAPDSLVPDLVEALPHCRFDRYFRANGLHHFVFDLYF